MRLSTRSSEGKKVARWAPALLSTLLLWACSQEGQKPPPHTVEQANVGHEEHPAPVRAEVIAPRPMFPVLTSVGQTLYVPAYSSLPIDSKSLPSDLAVVLGLHNTDREASVTFQTIDYYGTPGQKLESVISEPLALAPLESRQFLLKRTDRRGGSGANFIVSWSASRPVTAPMVETINVHKDGPRTFAITGRAQVLEEAKLDELGDGDAAP